MPPDDTSGYWELTATNDELSVNIADATTIDTRTNGYNITSDNVDAVLPLSNSHSWLDSGGHFGGASWGSTKYPNDTLLITLSNTSGTPPSVAVGDYITVGANTIEVS